MIPLIIVISVLAFFVLLLLIPISLDISFKDDFFLKLKIGGIKAFEIEPKSDENPKQSDTISDKKAEKVTENIFTLLKKKHGFSGAVKELFNFFLALLNRLKSLLKHILIRRLCLDMTVASNDAAQTAIEYGVVCSAVYPLLAFLDSNLNLKMKSVNVVSDFDKDKPDFSFSVVIKVKVIFLLVMAIIALSEYKNFRMRNEL